MWFCCLGYSVRSIVALNLHNYASGRNPWGKLKPEYLEKVPSMKFLYCLFLLALLFSFLHARLTQVFLWY